MGNIHNIMLQRRDTTLFGTFDDDRKVFRFFLLQKWYEADTIEAIWGYWEQAGNKDLV